MKRINVTKAFLPPIEDYEVYLRKIWASEQLTNQGPLLQEFEERVSKYLDVQNFQFVSNGTLALQLALRALEITSGEVITSPFSYVATTSSILWEHCNPVFVDIEPDTFNIDVTKIEAAITENTKAIMAVHVFGFPCDVEAIERIAKKHNLPVIYDGAHAFGTKYKGRSLLSYGDVSTCSFHATKLFHTIEGGCVVVKDSAVNEKLDLIKRFGHNGDEHILLGINAKATEFQAAMGLCNLNYIDENIAKRKTICEVYTAKLKPEFRTVTIRDDDLVRNYMYFPVVLESENRLNQVIAAMQAQNIFPRRYFYPSLNKLPYLKHEVQCPVSESIANRIICLPLYADLSAEEVTFICDTMNGIQ